MRLENLSTLIKARVLIDNCVPYDFVPYIRAATVTHVLDLGWDKLHDRPLLEIADGKFDVIVTVDRNLPHQQNLSRYSTALIILRVPSNTTPQLRLMIDELNLTIEQIKVGEMKRIYAPNFQPRDYFTL